MITEEMGGGGGSKDGEMGGVRRQQSLAGGHSYVTPIMSDHRI